MRLIFIASACISIANAQTLSRELTADSRGRGTINFDSQRNEDVTSATVSLRRNGDADIRLVGRTTWIFIGRWTSGNSNDVNLEITNFGNSTAEGRGRITLTRGGSFDRVELSGRSRAQRFSVTFDADRRDGFPQRDDSPRRDNDREFVGIYRSTYSPRPGPNDYRIIRTMRINEDGSAEIVSRYQNRPPALTQENTRMHGTYLRNINDKRKITHSGTWRAFGRRLEVTLSNLEGNTRMVSRMTFEFRDRERTELSTTAWNQNDYGSVGFQFKRVDKDFNDDDDSGQGNDPGQTPNRLAGNYSTRLRLPDADAEIERTLQLSVNGEARLVTEWVGGRSSRVGFRAVRELGRVIRGLENQRSVVHHGRWRYSNNQIIVEFESLDRVREQSSMTFDVRGDTLDAVTVDQAHYGDRRFTLLRTR